MHETKTSRSDANMPASDFTRYRDIYKFGFLHRTQTLRVSLNHTLFVVVFRVSKEDRDWFQSHPKPVQRFINRIRKVRIEGEGEWIVEREHDALLHYPKKSMKQMILVLFIEGEHPHKEFKKTVIYTIDRSTTARISQKK